jgi:hypothetical protein
VIFLLVILRNRLRKVIYLLIMLRDRLRKVIFKPVAFKAACPLSTLVLRI